MKLLALVCPDCPPARLARELVVEDHFLAHLGQAMLPFAITGLAIVVIARLARRTPMVAAALCLGVGLGGFVDGILLHQILQWHSMLSSVVPPNNLVDAKFNMVWDGAFHTLTWATTLTGVWLLSRVSGHRRSRLHRARLSDRTPSIGARRGMMCPRRTAESLASCL